MADWMLNVLIECALNVIYCICFACLIPAFEDCLRLLRLKITDKKSTDVLKKFFKDNLSWLYSLSCPGFQESLITCGRIWSDVKWWLLSRENLTEESQEYPVQNSLPIRCTNHIKPSSWIPGLSIDVFFQFFIYTSSFDGAFNIHWFNAFEALLCSSVH